VAVRSPPIDVPIVEVRTHLWYSWSAIAIAHEAEAVSEVRRLLREWETPGTERSLLVEMLPAMVAIVASADAIDALHADIAPYLEREADPRQPNTKWGYMLTTFQGGYRAANHWHPEFEWLFGTRGKAVHYIAETSALVRHPVLPTNVAPANATFSAKSATRAVDLLLDVLKAVLTGATAVEAAVRWARPMGPVASELAGMRVYR
jgi:hypothetical protein